nr:MAG TPA: hypothetical protein [Caudoviricetes sp.]
MNKKVINTFCGFKFKICFLDFLLIYHYLIFISLSYNTINYCFFRPRNAIILPSLVALF